MSAKEELSKLNKMSFKDKLWYIWSYYKFHIAGVILVIAVLSVIGASIYNSTFNTELYCIILNNKNIDANPSSYFEDEFADYIGTGAKDKIVVDYALSTSYGDSVSELDYGTTMKLTALISNHDIDVMISDKEVIDHYASIGGFLDLETVLPDDIKESIGDSLYYTTDKNGERHAYAVSLENTNFKSSTGIEMTPVLLGIISNSERETNAVSLIKFIFR